MMPDGLSTPSRPQQLRNINYVPVTVLCTGDTTVTTDSGSRAQEVPFLRTHCYRKPHNSGTGSFVMSSNFLNS